MPVLFISFSLLAFLLTSCSSADEVKVMTAIDSSCHIATAVEAADPSLVAHNGKLVAGQSIICGLSDSATAH